MKFNKWTLGLAAVGVVSLASAARADEKMNSLQTALSNTTISGYVSASFNWAVSPGGYAQSDSPSTFIPFQGGYIYPGGGSNTGGKQDGFNLDVVKLSIAKPEDESPWASGYQVDLLFGPDAVGYNPAAYSNGSYYDGYGDIAIKQAYVTLRTPVGNGIDWKVGVFDTIIGYEVTDAGSNPNYTRSWGYAVEPVEHTGVLASYKVNDELSFSAGIANTLESSINSRNLSYNGNLWHKTYMGSVTYTAPASWGWAAGSSVYAGIVGGWSGTDGYSSGDQVNYYAGATFNTPWKQLTAGVAFDYVHNLGGGFDNGFRRSWNDDAVIGLYATFKATDKLSFSGRGEMIHGSWYQEGPNAGYNSEAFALTGTVEYDLWANVISRLELRWDHLGASSTPEAINAYAYGMGNTIDHTDSVGFYANIIYKF